MQSLLRTRPENIDDLTVQVALVRPGPIQGKAVHPYIEHRQRLREDAAFVPPVDHPLLADCLRSTLGVVVFQDQVLDVAIALAGFSVGEAEGLRRAMSRKRSHDALEAYRERFVAGRPPQRRRRETADMVYDKLVGFSGFGFPKSHAAAFGLLAYQSAWLRHHHPAEFLCALLNAQPMGFYPPATLVRDGQRRGVETRPPDVNISAAKCTLEDGAVRIGIDYVNGIGGGRCGCCRRRARTGGTVRQRPRPGPAHAALGARPRDADRRRRLRLLRTARRQLLWQLGLVPRSQSVPGSGGEEKQLALPLDPTTATPELPEPTVWERMLADYRTTNLSVGVHPMELLRAHLPAGVISSRDLENTPDRAQVAIAGMAVARQRPATANGVVFMLIEDEFGPVNLIVPPSVYDKHRAIVRSEPLVLARGRFERIERNQNVLVRSLETLGPLARRISEESEVGASLPSAHHFGHR